MSEYVVYHQDCGHVGGISNSPDIAQAQLAAGGGERAGWRVREGATDEDILLLLFRFSCDRCSLGGST